jgi:hypothetical protein
MCCHKYKIFADDTFQIVSRFFEGSKIRNIISIFENCKKIERKLKRKVHAVRVIIR